MLKKEWNERLVWLVPVAVTFILLISFGMYQWVVPRTDLEVRTVYHEAPGGGGTGGTIHFNVLLSNLGNREVSSLECKVLVQLKGGGRVASHETGPEILVPGDNMEIKIVYIGSQYDTYTINIEVRFDCSGETHTDTLDYETKEDLMNMVFVEKMG